MTLSREGIEALIMRMQSAFIESPALELRLVQVARRFGIDAETCQALLEALVESQVLTVTPAGAYARFFPHPEDAPQRRSRAA